MQFDFMPGFHNWIATREVLAKEENHLLFMCRLTKAFDCVPLRRILAWATRGQRGNLESINGSLKLLSLFMTMLI